MTYAGDRVRLISQQSIPILPYTIAKLQAKDRREDRPSRKPCVVITHPKCGWSDGVNVKYTPDFKDFTMSKKGV